MIDLLLGGSPCQGFSFAGKQLSFSDPRITRRKKDCFYVIFENGSEKKPICIRYSDTLHEDEIFSNKDLKDLRLNEEK